MATDIKRVEKPHVLTGTGAPTNGDQLTENTAAYPVNTIYFDKDSGIGYVRAATTKVAATDWVAGSGGSTTIGGSYDDNTTAIAALGAGKLYKSSTLINGSPIVLITV